MAEQIDPAIDASGGTVGRSYAGGTHPTELAGIIGQAIDDLAARLGIDEDAVAVTLVQEVVWGDASLGCPQPGMRYTQVVTDGMRIVLEADGAFYDYRADGVRAPFLCEQPPLAEEGSTPLLELREDGSVVTIAPPPSKDGGPTETITPPGP